MTRVNVERDTRDIAQAAQKATKAASDSHLSAGRSIMVSRGRDLIEISLDDGGKEVEKVVGKVAKPNLPVTQRRFKLKG